MAFECVDTAGPASRKTFTIVPISSLAPGVPILFALAGDRCDLAMMEESERGTNECERLLALSLCAMGVAVADC